MIESFQKRIRVQINMQKPVASLYTKHKLNEKMKKSYNSNK